MDGLLLRTLVSGEGFRFRESESMALSMVWSSVLVGGVDGDVDALFESLIYYCM